MPQQGAKRLFYVRISAEFLKDNRISADARLLYCVLAAYADSRTGISYVRPKTLQKTLRWGRRRREQAQGVLVERGYLKLGRKPCARGRWGTRTWSLPKQPATIARFERSGENAQLYPSPQSSHVTLHKQEVPQKNQQPEVEARV